MKCPGAADGDRPHCLPPCARMGSQRKTIVALVGAAALAAPSAAAAQGSVDEQYRDPFAGQGDGGSQSTEPAQSDAPAQSEESAPSVPQSSDAAAATPTPTAAAPEELPRTGAPAVPIAAAAFLLIAAGTTLRRRLL
jgi:hypothetical protein